MHKDTQRAGALLSLVTEIGEEKWSALREISSTHARKALSLHYDALTEIVEALLAKDERSREKFEQEEQIETLAKEMLEIEIRNEALEELSGELMQTINTVANDSSRDQAEQVALIAKYSFARGLIDRSLKSKKETTE